VLYARRGDIELAVLLVKEHLHVPLLWSAKTVVIQQQVWAVLIIAPVLQALRLEIAQRAGVDPFEVSLPLLGEDLPRFAAQGCAPIAVFVEHGRALRFIRPSSRTRFVLQSSPSRSGCSRPRSGHGPDAPLRPAQLGQPSLQEAIQGGELVGVNAALSCPYSSSTGRARGP